MYLQPLYLPRGQALSKVGTMGIDVFHMSYSRNSLKGDHIGDNIGDYYRVYQGGYQEARL